MDFLNSLVQGNLWYPISYDDKIIKVSEILGQATEKVGDRLAGYLYYKDCIRLGYLNEKIDEIGIDFINYNGYAFKVSNRFEETFDISGATLIHEFIYVLNTNNITWKCIDTSNITTFIICISEVTYLYFDLFDGKLFRIIFAKPRNSTNKL